MTDEEWLHQARAASCYHESAHAVVALALGVKVKSLVVDLSADPTSPSGLDGEACALVTPALYRARKRSKAARIVALEKDAKIAFAGPHASLKIGDTLDLAGNDFRYIQERIGFIMCLKCGDDRTGTLSAEEVAEAMQIWQRLCDEARALVEENWPVILHVAAHLHNQTIISKRQLDGIIKEFT